MSRLVGLYPAAWRARYEAELEDLVASRPLGVGGSVDLVRGVIDAHRHPELVDPAIAPATGFAPVSRQRYEDLRVARRLGIGSFVGATLWIIGVVVALNGPVIGTGEDAYVDGMAAMPIILTAMALLSGGLIGHLIRLPARARIARIGAVLAMFSGPLWALGPWNMQLALIAVIGLVVLAIDSWWLNEWSGPAAGALVGFVALAVASTVTSLLLDVRDPLIGMVIFAIPIWLIVGATLQAVPEVSDVERDGARDEPASGIAPA